MSDLMSESISLEDALKAMAEIPDSSRNQFTLTFDFGEIEAVKEATKNGKARRKTVKWTPEEQQFVINGYCHFGPLWTEILKEYPFHPNRVHTDLRDKWDNIMRHRNDPLSSRLFDDIDMCLNSKRDDFLANPENVNGDREGKQIEPFEVHQKVHKLVREHLDQEKETHQEEPQFHIELNF